MSDTTGSASTPTMELSILMPCLNEQESLPACIEKAQRFLREAHVQGEIIIADNGSTDGSQAIAQRLGARVVSVDIKGYGSALLGGIDAARGRYIIMGDADDSYDFEHLSGFLEKLREGYDLVMGNRFRGGIRQGAMPLLNRFLGNPVLTGMGRFFFKSPVGDFYCGLRGFSQAAVTKMQLKTTGMEFGFEMVINASMLGMRVTEVPTTLSPAGRSRPPHLRPWQDGWRTLRFLLIYSPRWLFLMPGALLMFAGLAVGVWLLPGPQTLGGVTYDVHTLLYAAMAILVGFQGVNFAAFTKLFAISEGLVPEDPRLAKVFRIVTLEVGLVIGGACILFGLFESVQALATWHQRAFGPLNPFTMLRRIIPAITLLVLGCQIVFSSFFMSVLWLRRRRPDVPHPHA